MRKLVGTVLAALVAAGTLLLSGGVALADPGPNQDPGTSQFCTSAGNFGVSNSHGACTSHYQARKESNAIDGVLCQSAAPPQGQTCVAPGQQP